VLHPPRKDEQPAIDQALERAEGIVDLLVDGKFEAAMLRLHTR
jgi:PTH1 family peptidyl-tRNA hydrolase